MKKDLMDRGLWALETVLHEPSQESLNDMIGREQSDFYRASAPLSNTTIMSGAGALGRFTLNGLRKLGIEPLAFSDNNSALWSKQVDDLVVLPPRDAAAKYGGKAAFVVTIYRGSPVRDQLRGLSCRKVVPYPYLFWKYSEGSLPASGLELPHQILEQAEDIRKGYTALSRQASKREFCEQLSWRILLDCVCLSPPENGQHTYFPPDLGVPLDKEVLVDCGAFDGASIRSFLFRERTPLIGSMPSNRSQTPHRAEFASSCYFCRTSAGGYMGPSPSYQLTECELSSFSTTTSLRSLGSGVLCDSTKATCQIGLGL